MLRYRAGLDVRGGSADESKVVAVENWVVAGHLGIESEAWIHRQILRQTRLRPRVVCWEYRNRDVFPLGDIPVHVVPLRKNPGTRIGRWLSALPKVPHGNFLASSGSERRALSQLVEETKPSVILCHFGFNALRVLRVAQAHRVPVVAHFHGLDASSLLRDRLYRWSLRRCLRRFAAIIVVGSHQRQRLIEVGAPPERIHVIPCGVPTEEFAAERRSERTVVRFICVSRLVSCKGLQYTIRAFAQVSRHLNAELVVVGEGPERPALELLVKELGVNGVVFRGALVPSKVKRELQDSDVFLQHSVIDSRGAVEGFGVSISEAMAMELPVVATRVGGIPDQVVHNETGYLVDPGDEDGMASAMLKLALSPELRRALGQAARARMVKCFDTAIQVRRLEDVLYNAAQLSCG